MSTKETWYAVHLGRSAQAPHAGWLRLARTRDTNSRRLIEQQVSIHGRLDGRAIHTNATCRIALTRREGRLVPLESSISEGDRSAQLRFDSGRMHASGLASSQDGDAAPDDALPTYAVFAMAQGIYNQAESSLAFTPVTEMTGQFGTSGAKLVCMGKVVETPFPSDEPLWEVIWLSPEGTRVQAFYFDEEGELAQADWGGSRARRVATEAEAKPVPKPGRSTRVKKVAG
jgi:hypothetical protein